MLAHFQPHIDFYFQSMKTSPYVIMLGKCLSIALETGGLIGVAPL